MSISLEYVAGLFDGEGWARVQTPGMRDGVQTQGGKNRVFPSYQIVAGIAMTYKPIMLTIHEQFGGTLHGDDHYRRKDPKNRTIYRWHVQSRKAQAFFSAIFDHLIVKREQVELCLQLQDHISQHLTTMTRRSTGEAIKAEICAYRKDLAEQITNLKKVNYDLPVDHGASPYRF